MTASFSFEVTTVPLHFDLFQGACIEPPIELEDVCALWSGRLRREGIFGWMESIELDEERREVLDQRIEACGPLALLRAVQDHHGDWEAVESRLRDCVPVAAEATDRTPD